jgi:hypothetical protein
MLDQFFFIFSPLFKYKLLWLFLAKLGLCVCGESQYIRNIRGICSWRGATLIDTCWRQEARLSLSLSLFFPATNTIDFIGWHFWRRINKSQSFSCAPALFLFGLFSQRKTTKTGFVRANGSEWCFDCNGSALITRILKDFHASFCFFIFWHTKYW